MLKEFSELILSFLSKITLALFVVAAFFNFSLPVSAQNLTNEMLVAYIAKQKINETTPNNLFNPQTWQSQKMTNELAGNNLISSENLSKWTINSYMPTSERLKKDASERQCLAQAIYHEARGEPEKGQWAVVNVILNRVASPKYPATICGVVFQNADKGKYKCQFTFACDGISNKAGEGNRIVRISWVRSNLIALAAFKQFQSGKLPDILPDSALFYHTQAVSPSWSEVYKVVATIGNHIFYAKS